MSHKRIISLFLASVMIFGSFTAVLAEERVIGGVDFAAIGFVGGDFENAKKTGDKYVVPSMLAYTTYGSSHTITGLSDKSTGEGEIPIVEENGNKVFKLQPTSLANATSGKSLNNAFGFKIVKQSDYGKIQDITGDVTISFKMKTADPECLDKVLFAIRPSHASCGQHSATSGVIGGTNITGSEITATNLKKYFPAGEWVDVELTFSRSTFYDKADFATHTWGGSHGSCNVTEANALRRPVFYVRPYFNYGTTNKTLDKYSIYLDDFTVDAPTSAKDKVSEVVTDLTAANGWTIGTMDDATAVTEVTKNGAEAWQFDPAIDKSISGFEETDPNRWARAGQRMCVQTSGSGITFDTNSWYKLTAYVMVQDGVKANITLGTAADATKTWVGKPILGIKMSGNPEQSYESAGRKTYYKNIIVTEGAKTDWQKMELCFMPVAESYGTIQLNATAGVDERFLGAYGNMVLPTYWIRKDVKIEKVDTANIAQGQNIVEIAAPYYLETSLTKAEGWLYANNETYTAYPKLVGRGVDTLAWETLTFNMNEPLDASKNYKIFFNIGTNHNKFTRARVIFNGETSSATLMKIIPEEANGGSAKMVFDTRDVSNRDLKTEDTPLTAIGDIKSIKIAIDSSAIVRDGSVPDTVSFTISDLKIERIEPALEYNITLSGNTATLTVTNNTDSMWEFKGMLFVSEYSSKGALSQLASNSDVTIYVKPGESVSENVVFSKALTAGNTVKAFLWNQNAISPVQETVVLK